MDELPDWVKPGASFTYDHGPNNRNTGRKVHVRGIVDGMAVLREWSKTKQRWSYTVEHPIHFEVYKDSIVPGGKVKV